MQDIIQSTIASFIHYYQHVMVRDIPIVNHDTLLTNSNLKARIVARGDIDPGTLLLINSGDCGVAAIAIGLALHHQGLPVVYVDNINHGYICVEGVFYDTLTPGGTRIESQMYGYSEDNDPIHHLLVDTMAAQWITADPLGIAIVNGFLTHNGYPPYEVDCEEDTVKYVIDGLTPYELIRLD